VDCFSSFNFWYESEPLRLWGTAQDQTMNNTGTSQESGIRQGLEPVIEAKAGAASDELISTVFIDRQTSLYRIAA